jgi:Caspase domain/inactive STAND
MGEQEAIGQVSKVGKYFALLVGVNKYAGRFPPLKGCVNDVCGLESTLNRLDYCDVICLHDDAEKEEKKPTANNVQYHLECLAGVMAKEDTLLVHFSCHGWLNEDVPVLILKDVRLEKQGLPIATLKGWMHDTGASKLVLSLDACYSGAAVGTKGGNEDERFIENVYRNSEGFVTIASSRGQQKSQELVDQKNGLYSYYFIRGLEGASAGQEKKSFVTVRDVYNYILHNVREACKKTPEITQDPMYDVGGCGEIILADYRTRKALLVKLEPNLYQIDYHDARERINSIVGRLRQDSGPALFLLQNEKQVRGDLCFRYLRNCLDDLGEQRREYAIGALDMGGDYTETFVYKLADYLEVDCRSDRLIADVVDKLCEDAVNYSSCVLSIQIKQEDDQNPFLDWFLSKFWSLLTDRLEQMKQNDEEAVIVGILSTDKYLADEQLSQTSCDDVGSSDRKFFDLPISAWTEQDIKQWLRGYARPPLSPGECTGIADEVFKETAGIPSDAWEAIQDIIQKLGRKESA